MTNLLRLKTNLNCRACVATVKPHLDAVPGITRWEVDTSVPEKVLTVEGEGITEKTVQAAVERGGFQTIGPIQPATTEPALEGPEGEEPRSTYFPLILLVSYLVGIVGLVELRADGILWERAMQNFMGGFFVAFSFFKLLDLRGFADSYRMYDVVARRIPAYGYVYPFIELLLGVAYLAGFQSVATNIATIGVMSVSSVGVVQSLLEKRKIRCACLGTVFNLPMSTVTLIEDGTMIAMAAAMLAFGPH